MRFFSFQRLGKEMSTLNLGFRLPQDFTGKLFLLQKPLEEFLIQERKAFLEISLGKLLSY